MERAIAGSVGSSGPNLLIGGQKLHRLGAVRTAVREPDAEGRRDRLKQISSRRGNSDRRTLVNRACVIVVHSLYT